MSQLKKNVLYSLTLTFSRFFFPIITYPYISRVLGPDKVGILNFSENYANYFVVIAALGIPLYGVREIAKVKDDEALLKKTFTEIGIIHLISTVVCLAFFVLSVIVIQPLRNQVAINLLFGANILISFISFEWLLIGIEKFKLIALRSILTKLIPIIFMFLLVKNEDDYLIYQSLNTFAFLLNAIVNIINVQKFNLITFKQLNLSKHISPLLTVFLGGAFINFYSMTDSIILGFVSNYKQVGFYAVAIKLGRMICLIVASIGNVLTPRISSLVAQQDYLQIESVISKSLRLTIFITVPLAVGTFILSKEFIDLLAGSSFYSAINLSRILSPIIVLMGLSNVFAIQILLPYSKEKDLVKIFFLTTIVSIILNTILSNLYDSVGTAIATTITEILLIKMTFHYAKTVVTIHFPWAYLLFCLLISFAFFPITLVIRNFVDNSALIILLSVLAGAALYLGFQYLFFARDFKVEIISFVKNLRKPS